MKISIIGAGIIGVCTAYKLLQEGHDITIIETNPQAGAETSFKNGGQLSISYAEPWASIPNLLQMIQWIGKDDSPLLIRPQLKYEQISWFLKFIYECQPSNNINNTLSLIKMASNSLLLIKEVIKKHNFQCNFKDSGILCIHTSQQSLDKSINSSVNAKKLGIERHILSKNECIKLEPTLAQSSINFMGGDFTPIDAFGDAFIFIQEMVKFLSSNGCNFLYNTKIVELNKKQARAKLNNTDIFIDHDYAVICCGVDSNQLLLKNKTPIYPAKGYSATFDFTSGITPNISITDSVRKTVLTPLGNKLRVAGTAEFSGYDKSLNPHRCELLKKIASDFFGSIISLDSADFWCGLRPSTPSNIPIISKTDIHNVFICAGHGTLGWTLCMDSAERINNLINKEKNDTTNNK